MSPTRRRFLTGAAAFVAPLSIPAIGLSTIEPAGDPDAGIALPADPDDVPFEWYDDHGNAVLSTWRELDQRAFDALDRITGATFLVTFQFDDGTFGMVEFKLRDG